VSHLVYSASGRDVSATVVQGRVLMAHGRHETLDLAKVLASAQAAGDIVSAAAP
jgi:cytosine/adenosine deaminase-related metal-dependent hydrolase